MSRNPARTKRPTPSKSKSTSPVSTQRIETDLLHFAEHFRYQLGVIEAYIVAALDAFDELPTPPDRPKRDEFRARILLDSAADATLMMVDEYDRVLSRLSERAATNDRSDKA